MSSERFKQDAAMILSELERRFGEDDLQGVIIGMVLGNGDVRHLMVHDHGAKMSLLAVSALSHQAMLDSVRAPTAVKWSSSGAPPTRATDGA